MGFLCDASCFAVYILLLSVLWVVCTASTTMELALGFSVMAALTVLTALAGLAVSAMRALVPAE